MEKNIKFCAVGRIQDGILLVSYANESKVSSSAQSEAKEIIAKLVDHPIGAEQRQRVSTSVGVWNFLRDDNMVAYFVMTSLDYEERYAWKMIEELQSRISEYGNLQTLPENGLKHEKKLIFSELCQKYDDVASIDPLAMAHSRVNSIRGEMDEVIGKVTKNHESVTNLQGKTENMKGLSKSFGRKAEEVKRIMWWRKCKMNLILFLIVAAVLAYILAPILSDYA